MTETIYKCKGDVPSAREIYSALVASHSCTDEHEATKPNNEPMIQPNEQRIGNWVNDAGMNALRITEIPATVPLYYPIKLTPQSMYKAGFKKIYATQQGEYDLFSLNGFRVTLDFNIIHDFKKIELKGLHHLQNLYHALTGEELQCNIS